MGLDMYLHAKKYISNYDFYPKEQPINHLIKEALGLDHLKDESMASIEVTVTVAYWRKANQIHSWFVTNCQDGVDDCKEYYVERKKLEELRDLCNVTLTTKKADLLPPQSGFFFGSTDVDEWYWSDIEHTSKELTKLLKDESLSNYDFYYRSSW